MFNYQTSGKFVSIKSHYSCNCREKSDNIKYNKIILRGVIHYWKSSEFIFNNKESHWRLL
jgi:hypothetical protein